MLKNLKQSLYYAFIKRQNKMNNGFYSLYLKENHAKVEDEIETYFTTSDGRRIPVYKHYRYSIKKCWRNFNSLLLMNGLLAKGLINPKYSVLFRETIGLRAITSPIDEANEIITKFITENHEYFVGSITPTLEYVYIKPTLYEINNLIALYKGYHTDLIDNLKAFSLVDNSHNKVLEIGFISGGHSIYAFERLGFEAFGIDNFYGDLAQDTAYYDYIRSTIGSKAKLTMGDITKQTEFEDNSFDIVYSVSVLEHIMDLDGAFSEMYRILKPGGVVICCYDPFYSTNGGHAFGIPDSPWGHLRMSWNDYCRYITELRPHESKLALQWLECSINRNASKLDVQHSIVASGLEITYWRQSSGSTYCGKHITNEILNDCFNCYPYLTLDDIICTDILFVAKKRQDFV